MALYVFNSISDSFLLIFRYFSLYNEILVQFNLNSPVVDYTALKVNQIYFDWSK